MNHAPGDFCAGTTQDFSTPCQGQRTCYVPAPKWSEREAGVRSTYKSPLYYDPISSKFLRVALFSFRADGIPQTAAVAPHITPVPAKGGPTGGGGEGKGGGGGGETAPITGSGIPNVTDAKNPVCVPWYGIRDAIMGGIFQGRCGDNARAAIRLAFHDAGTFSLALQANALPNGGADGSLLVDPNEVLRSENNGLQNIVSLLKPLPAQFGVSPGDIVHLAGVLAVLACPGGPVIPAYVGRDAPRNIAPTGLLPNPEDPVDVLLARFADIGFDSREVMALIGAHTTGKQRFVDTAVANTTFDTTVQIWDTRFYTQTADPTTDLPGTFKLDSDVNFATNPTTATDFKHFIGKQATWITEYAAAHEKMSLLGFQARDLTDCSEILPLAIDLTNLAEVTTTGGGKPPTDPLIDPIKLEAAIQQFRSIWLVPQ
ncbi:Peroxidase [Mycena sanguinolenta]|uniref:Peroxidase n=1 Tax=Mycena sanguinolenta TaxID=230812 RepID=A0A8H6Y4E2_9AGAR|nr:Peroxidase [Mycena sanguinolenta]